MVNSSGQKLSFLMYCYNITLSHHKLIDAPTDRIIHVFTSAVSTDLRTQLLNIVPSVHRQHLPLPTWTHPVMPKVDRTRVGFLWVWTDPLSCPSVSSVCLISYTDIRFPHLHSHSLSLFLQLLLYTMQYSTMSFKKHTATFPAEAETAPRSIHYTTPHKQQRRSEPTLPQLSLLPFLLDAKHILIGTAGKTRIKAAKLFIPYLSKDLSSPAGERMETGNPAALRSLHYQLFT